MSAFAGAVLSRRLAGAAWRSFSSGTGPSASKSIMLLRCRLQARSVILMSITSRAYRDALISLGSLLVRTLWEP